MSTKKNAGGLEMVGLYSGGHKYGRKGIQCPFYVRPKNLRQCIMYIAINIVYIDISSDAKMPLQHTSALNGVLKILHTFVHSTFKTSPLFPLIKITLLSAVHTSCLIFLKYVFRMCWVAQKATCTNFCLK